MPARKRPNFRNVLLDELENAFGELPGEQREVFVSHEREGRSFKELLQKVASTSTPMK